MFKLLKILLLLFLFTFSASQLFAQKLIEYQSGMGSRDPNNTSVWILYNNVSAFHEGMTLLADSALLNTDDNSLSAFSDIVIHLTDTTRIFGDFLFYNGSTRIIEVWGDTVTLIDGKTTLITDNLVYDRNRSVASYRSWGHTTNGNNVLISDQGYYYSNTDFFEIFGNVMLDNGSNVLFTDSLLYSLKTDVAEFRSPTVIKGDSVCIYSNLGYYNTSTKYAVSFESSKVVQSNVLVQSDTMYHDDERNHTVAKGSVFIWDSVNALCCYGGYGETMVADVRQFMVTDSALAVYFDGGDSVYVHADTLWSGTDSLNSLQFISASYKVKIFRSDIQAMCDSLYYFASDSSAWLYGNPVIWYDSYQAVADTVKLVHDSVGIRLSYLYSDAFVSEKVDNDRFNQIKGRSAVIYFMSNEPWYADVIGSAQMVYYILDEDVDGSQSLIGVNAGYGSNMRLYFHNRAPNRLVTYGNPDMRVYPPLNFPSDQKFLLGFGWYPEKRPNCPMDVFVW